MQAVIQYRYGPPEALALREIDRPGIGEGDVLVRVAAAALHVGDVFAMRGSPFPVRAMTGLRRPRYGVPGFDVAGTVEAVGGGVTRFSPGDRVFGSAAGTSAEFARAPASTLVRMPDGLTFQEAAAIPTSALAALHGLRDAGRLRAGQRVLINGASGGVGTFAIQIATAMGAHVTGVASTRNLQLMRELGADEVIDYTREDFTAAARRYDLILDNVENRSLSDVRRALTPDGTLVLNSGTGATGLAMLVRLVRPLLVSPFVRHSLRRFVSNPNGADLQALVDLVEAGRLRPVIDRTFTLDQTAEALRHIEAGHAAGKVVIAVRPAA
jgi:NADPH:quinone reductase-like Zn-dependent oxidoreductase